jgi:hypothetical protein
MNANRESEIEPSGEFAASIRDFRSAVTHVADRETAGPVGAGWLAGARKRRHSAQQRMVLGWAAAALLCLATLPLATHSRHAVIAPPALQTATTAAPAPQSDTALLEQVDADLSESVPSPLAPLTELDSWTNASSDASNNGTLNKTETTNADR